MCLFWLFSLRFGAGDIMPEYSSLRPDPLGAKALYESLARMNGVGVVRNFDPLERLETEVSDPGNTTILFLGLDYEELKWADEETIQALDRLLLSGVRLVISLFPTRNGNADADECDSALDSKKEKPCKKKEPG